MKKFLSLAFLALFCLFANVARAQGSGQGSQGAVVDTYLSLDSLFTAWGDGSSYSYNDSTATGTLTLTQSWTGGEWDLDDASEDSYFGVYVKLKTSATCKIRLTVVYKDSDENEHYENYAIDGSGNDSEQWLFLPFDKDYDTDVDKIRIMCGDIGEADSITITLLSAELISPDDGGVNDNIRRIITSTNEGYGTYCCDKDFEMPEYLEGYIITNVAYTKSSTDRSDVEDDTTGDEVNSTDAKARVKKLAEGEEDSNDGDEDTDDEYDFNEGYYITIKKAFANDSTDTTGKYSKIVPAGVAILVKGCGDAPDAPITYTAYVDDENVETGQEKYVASDSVRTKYGSIQNNLLLGNKSGQTSMTAEQMQDSTVVAYNNQYNATDFYYYYLDYGKVTTTNGSTTYDYLGFYWMNNDGGAFAMTSNRAWLPLLKSNFTDDVTALKIIEYVEDDSEEQTTGITTVPAATAKSVSDGAVYTIQGVRVNNMNKPGVYIVDGKKVIKK